jgi:trehalose synthase
MSSTSEMLPPPTGVGVTSHTAGRPTTRPSSEVDPAWAADLDMSGPPDATNPHYVAWLDRQSMLRSASVTALQLSGSGSLWQRPFALPDPRAVVQVAPVWFTAYPAAFLTPPEQSFLATLSDPELWRAFGAIGIRAVHTGPVKQAGGLVGWESTPSIDGYFDRISSEVDEAFGTSDEFRRLCATAASQGSLVIDDLVPGHTGKGADFRLAEMAYRDYPGAFHMVLIDEADWSLLPAVEPGKDSANLDLVAERALTDLGYIVGPLQRTLFFTEGVKETNWAATAPVLGVDGVTRRWVYLHYFKEGQPSLNWIDPSFAAARLVTGDALQSMTDLGAMGLRLDANGFLGVERHPGGTAWSEDHPLSEAANHLIAGTVRRAGGFSFQELNLSFDAIKATSARGPDLSYDFVTRPAYHHALLTGDAEFLRLTLREALRIGVDTGALVHALQNHDELTYELVHFADTHHDDVYTFRGRTVTGNELAETVRADLTAALTGEHRPYNLTFAQNGIACTTASVCAAALGVRDLDDIDDADTERIRRAHLLLAAYNALQPGVFALSGWDLTGALPLSLEVVADLAADGDTRWINRPAHDLMGYDREATGSRAGIPRGRALYGDLVSQLAEQDSFANRLRGLVALRARSGVQDGTLVEVPDADDPGVLVLVVRRTDGEVVVVVVNFSSEPVVETSISSEHLPAGSALHDLSDDTPVVWHEPGRPRLALGAHDVRVLLAVAPQG